MPITRLLSTTAAVYPELNLTTGPPNNKTRLYNKVENNKKTTLHENAIFVFGSIALQCFHPGMVILNKYEITAMCGHTRKKVITGELSSLVTKWSILGLIL